jgi:hypothetical protein
MPAPTLAEFLLDKLLPSAKSGLLGFGYASGPTAKRCIHIMNTSSNPAQRWHHCHSRRRDLATDQQSMDEKVADRRVGGNVRCGQKAKYSLRAHIVRFVPDS